MFIINAQNSSFVQTIYAHFIFLHILLYLIHRHLICRCLSKSNIKVFKFFFIIEIFKLLNVILRIITSTALYILFIVSFLNVTLHNIIFWLIINVVLFNFLIFMLILFLLIYFNWLMRRLSYFLLLTIILFYLFALYKCWIIISDFIFNNLIIILNLHLLFWLIIFF